MFSRELKVLRGGPAPLTLASLGRLQPQDREALLIPVLPNDVRQWLLSTFGSCNQHVAKQLSALPTIHEPALDMALISHLSMFSGPTRFPSDWLIQVAAFFEGGRRHWRNWEIADIGFLITFRRPGAIPIQKLALLQSKRLYPDAVGVDVPEYIHGGAGVESVVYEYGGVDLFDQPRVFETSEGSSYRALRKGDNQYQVIPSYEDDTGVPVYYLFYNPLALPTSVLLPRMGGPLVDARCEVGCRVVPSAAVRDAMRALPENQSPTYALLSSELGPPFDSAEMRAGWPLERFLVDAVLRCEAGYRRRGDSDLSFHRVVALRGAPIASAISITFDVPGEGPFGE